jgi:phage terminase large subunit-like protein
VPRVRHAPHVRANDWEDVSDLAKAYGLVLDEWQENVLEAGMGVRSDGRWAASTVGVNVPRQNGKGALIEARELAGLLLFGEKVIIHSAHEQKTARVGFERILSYFENYDDLRKKVRSVMGAISREHIKLRNGAELHFPARSKGAIRGFSIDCLILDEAQILGDPAWEAIKPTISARPNTQTWLLGTTPTPLDDSAVFTRTRARGLEAKDQRLAWCEWSAEAGTSLDDRDAWAQANPALGVRIALEAIEDERAELSDHGFARERLGIWPTDETQRVIPAETWNPLAGAGPAASVPPNALAVDMSHDRVIAVAACWSSEDSAHVELVAVDRSNDTLAAVEWLVDRAGRRIPVVVDSASPAASMVPALKERRVKVVQTSATDMGKACGLLYDDAMAGRLTHAGQQQLDDALAGAKKRNIRDAGAWAWDRKDPEANIAPLVAATLARYGASLNTKTKTGRIVTA